jgi:hypothetical protein
LAQTGSGPSTDHVEQPSGGHVDHPGDELGVVLAIRGQERRLIHPERGNSLNAAGSSTSGLPYSRTAAMIVAHETPNSTAT